MVAEKELLRGTLRGSINLLREVIGQLKPEAAQFIDRIYPLVKNFSSCIAVDNYWEIEVAATLCLLGFITLPDQVIKKILTGRQLNPGQFQMYRKHIDIASVILSNIPQVRRGVEHPKISGQALQRHGRSRGRRQGTGHPPGVAHHQAGQGLRLPISRRRKSEKRALANIKKARGYYDPGLLDLFEKMITEQMESSAASIRTENP